MDAMLQHKLRQAEENERSDANQYIWDIMATDDYGMQSQDRENPEAFTVEEVEQLKKKYLCGMSKESKG